jgi:hypothetical protein
MMRDDAGWVAAEDSISGLLSASTAAERSSLFDELSNYSRSLVLRARAEGIARICDDELAPAMSWLLRPVFVCGHHRSGTTLLQELLDGHSRLVVIPTEVTYFSSFASLAMAPDSPALLDAFTAEWITRLIDPNGKRHFHLGRAAPQDNPSLRFARRLLAWHAVLLRSSPSPGLAPLLALAAAWRDIAMPGMKPLHWVEKTPLNERYVRRLAPLKEARFIQMVRNPVATLRSQLADLRGAGIAGVVPAEQVWRIGRSLRLAVRNRERLADRYLVVRYEDLVTDTGHQMNQVGHFLSIASEPALLLPTVLGRTVRSNSAFCRSDVGVIQPATQLTPLTTAEERMAKVIGATAASGFGYPTSPVEDLRSRASAGCHLLSAGAVVMWRRLGRGVARLARVNAARTP